MVQKNNYTPNRWFLICLILISLIVTGFAGNWVCLPGATCHVQMSATHDEGSSVEYILCYNEHGPQEPGYESLGGGAGIVECSPGEQRKIKDETTTHNFIRDAATGSLHK